jgi:hypothetical protein
VQTAFVVPPAVSEYLPAEQSRHTPAEVAAVVPLYVPSTHCRHAETVTPVEYVPAGQLVQVVWTRYFPAVHLVQTVAEPSELYSAGHAVHASLVPSTKYVPAPQHVATPAGVQWMNWADAVQLLGVHAVQDVLSAAVEYVPAAHLVQPASMLEPSLVE